MSDTSKDAVENFIQTVLKEAVLNEGLPRSSEDTEDTYETVALLRALTAKLVKVTAERDAAYKSVDENWITHQQVVAIRERAEAAEAMLPRAYRAGVEDVCRCKTYEPDCYQGQESMDEVPDGRWLDIDEIRALPTPTSAELLTMCAEKETGR